MMNTWKKSRTILLFGALFMLQAIIYFFCENYKIALVMLAVAVLDMLCGIIERNNEVKVSEN